MSKLLLPYLQSVKEASLEKLLLIKRTEKSQYWLYLAVRRYSTLLKIPPKFTTLSVGVGLSFLEERSFGGRELVVLNNLAKSQLKGLNPNEDFFILAEVESGEWVAPTSLTHHEIPGFLKLLRDLHGLKAWTKDVRALNWRGLGEPSEIESMVLRMKWGRLGYDDLSQLMESSNYSDLLMDLKLSRMKEIFLLQEKYGARWVYKNLITSLVLLSRFKVLKGLGVSQDTIISVLSISKYHWMNLEKLDQYYSLQEIRLLVRRVLDLDFLFFRGAEDEAVSLILLNSGLSVKGAF